MFCWSIQKLFVKENEGKCRSYLTNECETLLQNINLYISNFPQWLGQGCARSTSTYVNPGMFSTASIVKYTVKNENIQLLENRWYLLIKNWPFSGDFHTYVCITCIRLQKFHIANLFAKVLISGAQKCQSWYGQPYREVAAKHKTNNPKRRGNRYQGGCYGEITVQIFK